jgi:hypothetical protein
MLDGCRDIGLVTEVGMVIIILCDRDIIFELQPFSTVWVTDVVEKVAATQAPAVFATS